MSKLKYLVLLLVFTVVGCDRTTTNIYPEMNYSQFSVWFITDVNEQLTQNYDEYYLYFYGPYCGACEDIKNEALYKIELLENTIIFFVPTESLADVNSDIDITKTPSLVKVVGNEVEATYQGTAEVLSEINTLN